MAKKTIWGVTGETGWRGWVPVFLIWLVVGVLVANMNI